MTLQTPADAGVAMRSRTSARVLRRGCLAAPRSLSNVHALHASAAILAGTPLRTRHDIDRSQPSVVRMRGGSPRAPPSRLTPTSWRSIDPRSPVGYDERRSTHRDGRSSHSCRRARRAHRLPGGRRPRPARSRGGASRLPPVVVSDHRLGATELKNASDAVGSAALLEPRALLEPYVVEDHCGARG